MKPPCHRCGYCNGEVCVPVKIRDKSKCYMPGCNNKAEKGSVFCKYHGGKK